MDNNGHIDSLDDGQPDTKSTMEETATDRPFHYCSCTKPPAGKTARKLIVCIDGTSNQFGLTNTNVIELYSRILKSDVQLTYYNSGVGTYARPSWKSLHYIRQVIDNKLDMLIAWNLEKIILGAYRWLVEHYQPGDQIYLFGFSRGAYQVRALAAMIEKVGLVFPGNDEQIPFAYEVYADLESNRYRYRKSDPRAPSKSYFRRLFNSVKDLMPFGNKEPYEYMDMAARFKNTFSRPGVRTHFVGAWDTVSSVGIIRGKTLPLTNSAGYICFFRHALALDERRVKFLPEYVNGGVSETTPEDREPNGDHPPHIKEVWFAGCHSDVGGGNKLNIDLDLSDVPLQWMENEAIAAGLDVDLSKVAWQWDVLKESQPTESLTGAYKLFEYLLITRLTYKTPDETQRFPPHFGKGRVILPGQKIHASLAFKSPKYLPKATLSSTLPVSDWSTLIGKGRSMDLDWASSWGTQLELDLFDYRSVNQILDDLRGAPALDEKIGLMIRLHFISVSEKGASAIVNAPDGPAIVAGFFNTTLVSEITAASRVVQFLTRTVEHATRLFEAGLGDNLAKLLQNTFLLPTVTDPIVSVLATAIKTPSQADEMLNAHAAVVLVDVLADTDSYAELLRNAALGLAALAATPKQADRVLLTHPEPHLVRILLDPNSSPEVLAAVLLAVVRLSQTSAQVDQLAAAGLKDPIQRLSDSSVLTADATNNLSTLARLYPPK